MLRRLTGAHKPDILDCIANLSSDEVFTPPNVVNQILDLLPDKIWADPQIRILDPACKSGVFLREAARRLMVGLTDSIPDEDERRAHIFTSMLFGVAITDLTGLIARRSLYYTKDPSSENSIVRFRSDNGNIHYSRGMHEYNNGKCVHCGAPVNTLDRGQHLENHAYQFIHGKRIFDVKFDVIIGNPPYQLQDAGDSTGASPIYQHFVRQAKALEPRYIAMIIPSRWFAGGKGLDDFRAEMLGDKRISHLVDYHNAADCFPGVEIKGGVCYFLWDSIHKGACEVTPVVNKVRLNTTERNLGAYDVFVRFNEAVSILEKVREAQEPSIIEWISSRKPFGFGTNFTDFRNEQFAGAVKLFANKEIGWIDRQQVTKNQSWIDRHKVLLTAAYNGGDAYPHQIINRPIVALPGSCCTETYMVCGLLNSNEEAKNLEAYIKTKFFRFLVWLRKVTQHNPKDRFQFVPLLEMRTRWTDAMLFERYRLGKEEIAFIESMIKEMP